MAKEKTKNNKDNISRIQQFDVALRLAGFNFKKQHVELISEVYKAVENKGGKVTLEDLTIIENTVNQKYEDKQSE